MRLGLWHIRPSTSQIPRLDSLLSEVVAVNWSYETANFQPWIVCVLTTPTKDTGGAQNSQQVQQNDHRIIITATFKFIATIASKIFAFKVEILENVRSYPFFHLKPTHIIILILLLQNCTCSNHCSNCRYMSMLRANTRDQTKHYQLYSIAADIIP